MGHALLRFPRLGSSQGEECRAEGKPHNPHSGITVSDDRHKCRETEQYAGDG